MNILVDAHQDLAWNMLTFGRDYTLSAAETRQREAGSLAVRGQRRLPCLDTRITCEAVSPLVFATLFAAPIRAKIR